MDTSRHDLGSLLSQLGLASSPSEIAAFLASHRLGQGVALCEAPFWNKGQAQFLKEALDNDSDWSDAADKLAQRLSGPR